MPGPLRPQDPRSRGSYEALGLSVLSRPRTTVAAGGEGDLSMLNLIVVGFVSSAAAGIFVATLMLSPHRKK